MIFNCKEINTPSEVPFQPGSLSPSQVLLTAKFPKWNMQAKKHLVTFEKGSDFKPYFGMDQAIWFWNRCKKELKFRRFGGIIIGIITRDAFSSPYHHQFNDIYIYLTEQIFIYQDNTEPSGSLPWDEHQPYAVTYLLQILLYQLHARHNYTQVMQ